MSRSLQRPRELRRRIVLTAQIRSGAQWTDACILNISSRGMMIRSARALPEGGMIELHRGGQLIVARVMWRDGSRVGLKAEERIAVEDILSLDQTRALQLVAAPASFRALPRAAAQTGDWHSGRTLEFLGIGAIAVSLALAAWTMTERALTVPMTKVAAALTVR
jgi:hypothetical protein